VRQVGGGGGGGGRIDFRADGRMKVTDIHCCSRDFMKPFPCHGFSCVSKKQSHPSPVSPAVTP
jgi:uncharacterized protein YjhX (UPF0386 family)